MLFWECCFPNSQPPTFFSSSGCLDIGSPETVVVKSGVKSPGINPITSSKSLSQSLHFFICTMRIVIALTREADKEFLLSSQNLKC